MSRFPDAPARIAALPVDHRGLPIPWFVAWEDGKPVFPAMDPDKMSRAMRDGLCWVCGQKLGRHRCYVIGPMCVANQVSSEPPSHHDCAIFAAKHCPFLANPNMKRVPKEKYGFCTEDVAGIMIERNPGVTAVAYTAGRTRWFPDGQGVLFKVPFYKVEWYARGRLATREEVVESFESGLPILRAAAEEDGPNAVRMLEYKANQARELFPQEIAA